MIELNGVANIKILLDDMVKKTDAGNDEALIAAAKIYQQLDTLERYMVAIGNHLYNAEHSFDRTEERIPYWHEVRDNKDKYPLNGGRK